VPWSVDCTKPAGLKMLKKKPLSPGTVKLRRLPRRPENTIVTSRWTIGLLLRASAGHRLCNSSHTARDVSRASWTARLAPDNGRWSWVTAVISFRQRVIMCLRRSVSCLVCKELLTWMLKPRRYWHPCCLFASMVTTYKLWLQTLYTCTCSYADLVIINSAPK